MRTKKYYKLIRVDFEDSAYLRLKNVSNEVGIFKMVKAGSPTGINLEYSLDGTTWTTYDFSALTEVGVAPGANIYFRGDNAAGLVSGYGNNRISFYMNVQHTVGGNILTVLSKSNYSSITSLSRDSLGWLFYNDTNLVSAENLSFGNVTTVNGDSSFSFGALTSLFEGCTSLTTPPHSLDNVTSGVGDCSMNKMFKGCISLVTPMDLSTITSYGTYGRTTFKEFYSGCSNLANVIAPNVSSWSTDAFNNWLNNTGSAVSGTKTIQCPTGVTILTNSTSGIPTGWTRVDY